MSLRLRDEAFFLRGNRSRFPFFFAFLECLPKDSLISLEYQSEFGKAENKNKNFLLFGIIPSKKEKNK